ncbi:MAG: hypothetical protein GX329_04865 [Tissierellia bacterium]|nr:hypothetical protein [Tissierellia bacterium]
MHDGCTGVFESGKLVVDKIRMMGFNTRPMPSEVVIECEECKNDFTMTHLETKCPICGMVYGVTPCSASNPERIMAAGKNY